MELEMNKQFRNSNRKLKMENEEENFVEIGGITFNNQEFADEDDCDNFSYKDSVSFDNTSVLGEEEEDRLIFHNSKESDFLDLSDENIIEERGYDFEYEFGMQARKTLII